ncbi:MAG: SEL1-like repeat protein, partial [Synergistaceae bacterium]|nr:SEL1-like repeat protein [Synergistaceae bacterium]
WYEKAAANGNTVAQYEIGHMYDLGLGVERNYAKAIGWYEKSASNGNTDARYAILRMYNESLKNFIVASQNKEGQVPGEWVSNLVQNPFDELKRIRFGQNENVGGVEVRWIQNNSLLKRLGIQRGDIIRAVNGIPSLAIQDIINIINSLESSERLDFELTSGGENITLRYVIKK